MTESAEQSGWDFEGVRLRKAFGGAVALDGADFAGRYGEVHALLGENGAGKSTFVRIMAGALAPDEGHLVIGGETMALGSVRDHIARGIGTAFQELSLMPDLSVAENLFAGRETRSRIRLIDRRADERRAREAFDELEVTHIDPSASVRSLAISDQQIVEIVKVIARRPKILILDEATAALSREASVWLFGLVRQLVASGAAVLFISHRIREAFEIADRVTVFRNGKTVSSGATREYTEAALVEAMLGHHLAESTREAPAPPRSEVALEVSAFTFGRRFRDVDLVVRRGEILGIGGLNGQGQYDLLQALFGWLPAKGTLRLKGETVHLGSPRAALHRGIALVPQDRRTEGLMMGLSIRENLTLGILDRFARLGWIVLRKEQAAAREITDRFNIRATTIEQEVGTLSGGNQQKVLVGKVLEAGVEVLLLADVTRGIDVGTKADMYALIRSLAASGIAVIMYSSDSSELVSLCHRVAVMYDWTVGAVLEGADLTEPNLLRAAVGLGTETVTV